VCQSKKEKKGTSGQMIARELRGAIRYKERGKGMKKNFHTPVSSKNSEDKGTNPMRKKTQV